MEGSGKDSTCWWSVGSGCNAARFLFFFVKAACKSGEYEVSLSALSLRFESPYLSGLDSQAGLPCSAVWPSEPHCGVWG